MHAGPFDVIQKALDEEFARHHVKDEHQLWHALLFFTAGEGVRGVLQDRGVEYVPYAYENGLFSLSGSWGKQESLIRKYWLPYMRSQDDRAEVKDALKKIVD